MKNFTKRLVAFVNSARKAVLSAVGVAATLAATNGLPSNVQGVAAEVVAVAAAFGVTYKVANKA